MNRGGVFLSYDMGILMPTATRKATAMFAEQMLHMREDVSSKTAHEVGCLFRIKVYSLHLADMNHSMAHLMH